MDKMELLRATRELTGISNLSDLIAQAGVLEQYLNSTQPPKTSSTINLSPTEFARYGMLHHPSKNIIPFTMMDFQSTMLEVIHSNNRVIISSARQMGKSAVLALYILWSALSKWNYTIFVGANKMDQILRIMDPLKLTYENLPPAFSIDANQYSKDMIVFTNGSKIITRPVNGDASSGLAIDMLVLDEMAYISEKHINDFWHNTLPCMHADAKIILASTPTNFSGLFGKIWHEENGFTKLHLPWHFRPDRDQNWANNQKEAMGEQQFKLEYEALVSRRD